MSYRVLLVDDDLNVREIIGGLLEVLGYEYVTAPDGQAGLDHLRQESFSVLVTDIHMPRMDGLQLVQQARLLDPFLGIIVITGLTDLSMAVQVMKAGANEYLLKPVQFDALSVSLEKCLDHRRLQLEIQSYQTGLEEKVEQRTTQLRSTLHALQSAHDAVKQAHLDLITVLAKAAEINDGDTGHHVRRVSAYVATIAEHLGKTTDEIDQLAQFATIHDIGKVTIHPDILQKPGKLSYEEFDVMKQHTIRGAEILKQASSLEMAVNIALHHHEWYDGSGYPHGLSGDTIPFEARLTSIADVFDALTMRRCYKEAWTIDQAIHTIRAERGRQFDPTLVDAFLQVYDKIVTIRQALPE
ncbi:MAG: response regulator [Candidatus Latescibacteria bacterium]|nr:response regulator [Candidatus Latescibacterota bacterium]